MAAPRLPFLWPFLYTAPRAPLSGILSQAPRRGLARSTKRRQELGRYGTANEPQQPPILPSQPPQSSVKQESKAAGRPKKAKQAAKGKDADATSKEPVIPTLDKAVDDDVLKLPDPTGGAPAVLSVSPPSPSPPAQKTSSSASSPAPPASSADSRPVSADFQPTTPAPPPPYFPTANALSTVLNMPAPSSDSDQSQSQSQATPQPTSPGQPYYENADNTEEHKPPHISTPRYVHHFDTYSLVQRLVSGQWTESQSVTLMKAVRLILADNISLARDGLVSKSDVENETYLFRAACSELRTEVGMRRKSEVERVRTERGGLSHEVENLGQRVGMEVAGMREELRGMVEGRKMVVREEGRGVDSKIQELNYRITVALNSDAKSDVEGVRWLITRRAIVALFTCVAMVLGSLKYASSAMQAEEEARKRSEAAERAHRAALANIEGNTHRDAEARMEAERVLALRGGDNPSFVSLG